MITQSHDQPALPRLAWLVAAIVIPVLVALSGCVNGVESTSGAKPSPLPSVTPSDSSARAQRLAASVAGLNDLNENPVFTNASNDLVRLQQLVNHGGGLLGTVQALGARKPRDCNQISAVFNQATETAYQALALIQTIPQEVTELRMAIPASTAKAQQLIQQAAQVEAALLGQSPASEAYAQLGSLSTAKLLFELRVATANRALVDIPPQFATLAHNVRFVLAAQQRAVQLCGLR